MGKNSRRVRKIILEQRKSVLGCRDKSQHCSFRVLLQCVWLAIKHILCLLYSAVCFVNSWQCCLSVCLSVCLSHSRTDCVKTTMYTMYIIKLLFAIQQPVTFQSSHTNVRQNFQLIVLNSTFKTGGQETFTILDRYLATCMRKQHIKWIQIYALKYLIH